jgi:hypothetical protein
MSSFTEHKQPKLEVAEEGCSSGLNDAAASTKDFLRVVCISDTHSRESKLKSPLPEGDVLVHAGDFSNVGTMRENQAFRNYMDAQLYSQKIVIAGNHDTTMQTDYFVKYGERFHTMLFRDPKFDPVAYSIQCREIISNSSHPSYSYLEDSSCYLSNNGVDTALKVYGAPWQPEFCDWAFNLPLGPELKEKWDMIPNDTDVLITHGPPLGILDLASSGYRCGCPNLLEAIKNRVKPRLHIFGHIHEHYGKRYILFYVFHFYASIYVFLFCLLHIGTFFDGQTLFINASSCNLNYRPNNSPIVVDLPLDVNKPAILVSGGKL